MNTVASGVVFFELANKTPKRSAPLGHLIQIEICRKSRLIGRLDIRRSTGHQAGEPLLGAPYFLGIFQRSCSKRETSLSSEGIKSGKEPRFIFSWYRDQFGFG